MNAKISVVAISVEAIIYLLDETNVFFTII